MPPSTKRSSASLDIDEKNSAGRPPLWWLRASVEQLRRIRWYAVGAYALFLTVGSLTPRFGLTEIFSWSRLFSPDKIAHFGAYAVFAVLLAVAFRNRGRWSSLLLAFLTASVFGILMEVAQALSQTGREYDPVDMLANCLGALLGCLLVWAGRRLLRTTPRATMVGRD